MIGGRQAILWYLIQTEAMVATPENAGVLSMVETCRQGKHRSEIWANFEGSIIAMLGIQVSKYPLCKYLQDWEKCQRSRRECQLCIANSSYNNRLYQACRDEFWGVVLELEGIASSMGNHLALES